MRQNKFHIYHFVLLIMISFMSSCARMGNPDGGWYDEKPPRIVKTVPRDGEVGVNIRKVNIYFDEYIKIDNATENVVISPPQIEQADIKAHGKGIQVTLKDSLKKNTTYTIDFSDAIKDNNEGNPLGNYTYSFSTGDEIDTLQVSGKVVTADRDNFVEGIIVGLYSLNEDSSCFNTKPFLRVARTDANGCFVIKGVKAGKYHIFALKDMDQNFMLTKNSGEMMAFSEEVVTPSVFTDMRQDTIMQDQLHIKDVKRVSFLHYLPDNIILRAFNEDKIERNFFKYDRTEPERFVLLFSGPDKVLPELKGLNFSTDNAFLIDTPQKNDSITYWLKDTSLVNMDSLMVEMKYNMTDSLGKFIQSTDTLTLLPKIFYEKRQKQAKKDYDSWFKKELKKKKKGQSYDSIMPPKALEVKYSIANKFHPDDSVMIEFKTPIASIDTSKIHLFETDDTLRTELPYNFSQVLYNNIRTYKITYDWKFEKKYTLLADSCAFVDIYGLVSDKKDNKINIDKKSAFGELNLEIPEYKNKNIIVQLIDKSEKILREEKTTLGRVEFPYVEEKDYYLRMIVDSNNNGKWDTGNYSILLQPEEVHYFPSVVKCKADWTITKTWYPSSNDFARKPTEIQKVKSDKKTYQKSTKNLQRAQQLGIPLPDKLK